MAVHSLELPLASSRCLPRPSCINIFKRRVKIGLVLVNWERMIRSKLCTKTSFDLVRSCLCKRDGEAAARDVVKLLLTEPDPTGVRRTCRMSQLPLQPSLQHHIGLCHSPASESFIIFGCQGNSLLHQMGINMTPRPQNKQQQQHKSTLNNPTAVQLSIVLLRLREQVSLFSTLHLFYIFNVAIATIIFQWSS